MPCAAVMPAGSSGGGGGCSAAARAMGRRSAGIRSFAFSLLIITHWHRGSHRSSGLLGLPAAATRALGVVAEKAEQEADLVRDRRHSPRPPRPSRHAEVRDPAVTPGSTGTWSRHGHGTVTGPPGPPTRKKKSNETGRRGGGGGGVYSSSYSKANPPKTKKYSESTGNLRERASERESY